MLCYGNESVRHCGRGECPIYNFKFKLQNYDHHRHGSIMDFVRGKSYY